jgi:glucose/arabinose dehydrogenase
MKKSHILMVLLLISFSAHGAPQAESFKVTKVSTFDEAWAMTFLPNGKLLVTEKSGRLLLLTQNGDVSEPINNLPKVAYGGQGGLGDVVLHPEFSKNRLIYLSYAESGADNTYGAAVSRSTLTFDEDGVATLTDSKVIWRQTPKVTGQGHYGHRIAFDPQGYLFISSGDRQKFDPAQDMSSNMGKVLRLNDDGSVPQDNPFTDDDDIRDEIWSSGHRNPLGLAFDEQGRMWNAEMGPLHGDELNLVKRGGNYGYPIVSNGDHYSGEKIPNHDTRPDLEAPKVWWKPTIAPAEVIYYSDDMFPSWKNSFLIAGLRSQAIIRVVIDEESAKEVERIDMKARIREIEQGPDGSIWVLEDGPSGNLLKLSK